MSTERGPAGPHLPFKQSSGPEGPRSRNVWKDGLWIVALLVGIITLGMLYQTWLHLGPRGRAQRAQYKGDGEHVDSYGFDLSNLADGVNPDMIVATGKRKDEVPVLNDPGYITVQENEKLTGREKYVLPTDRVIGVLDMNDGQRKAYPIQVMQVHHLVNDFQAKQTVVYDPLSELVTCMTNDFLHTEYYSLFGSSGLTYKGLCLPYDKSLRGTQNTDEVIEIEASSQRLLNPLTGEELSETWRHYPEKSLRNNPERLLHNMHRKVGLYVCSVLQWRDWLALYPDTVIVARDEALIPEYKKNLYGPYYQADDLMYSVLPQIGAPQLKTLGLHNKSRGIGIDLGRERVFVPYSMVIENAEFDADGLGRWQGKAGHLLLNMYCRKEDVGFTPETVWEIGSPINRPMVMLFAWYANYPDTYILNDDGELVKPGEL